MITLKNISKAYGSVVALDQVDLHVSAGSVTGLLGPNGSGKSTIFRSILGVTPIDSGRIELVGITQPRGNSRQRQQIVSVADSDELYGDLSPMELTRMTWAFHCRILGAKTAFPQERFNSLGAILAMKEYAHRPLKTLSHGTRRKAQLLAAFFCDPTILLIDEPTNGLDPDQHVVVQVLLRTLAARGTAVLLSTHNLAFAESVCDAVVLLRGSVIAAGSPERIRMETGAPNLYEAYATLSMMDRGLIANAAQAVFA